MLTESLTSFAAGTVLFALASPSVAAAVREAAPAARFGDTLLVAAGFWALVFGVGAVLALGSGGYAAAGALGAAAELSLGAFVWILRGRRATLPDAYWDRWEAQFTLGDPRDPGSA